MAEANTGNGDVSNTMKKGTIKVVDIISDNKSGDWRKTLSGALDEQRLVCALVVLTIYYIVYSIGSAFHDNDEKDEDVVTLNCTCKPNQRNFYISWSVICYTLWGICHLLILIFSSKHCNLKACLCLLPCCGKNNNETLLPQNNQRRSDAYSYSNGKSSNNKSLSNDQLTFCNQFYAALRQLCPKIKSCVVNDDEIHRYEYYLWTQYYEFYAIGITNDIKIFNSAKVKRIFDNHLSKNKITSTNEPDGPESSNKTASIKQTSAPDVVALSMVYHIGERCSYGAHCVFHVILQVFRFSAQLVTVPLLMIQMLDTYAFLCLTADDYCTRRAQYDLNLDQTSITFGFYCSLLFSYLTTIMLRWIPWPKYKKPQKTS